MVDGVGMELVEDGVHNTGFDFCTPGRPSPAYAMHGGWGGFLIPGCGTRTPEYVAAQCCAREIYTACFNAGLTWRMCGRRRQTWTAAV